MKIKHRIVPGRLTGSSELSNIFPTTANIDWLHALQSLALLYSTVTLYFIPNIEDEIFQLPLVDMEEIAQKVSQ